VVHRSRSNRKLLHTHALRFSQVSHFIASTIGDRGALVRVYQDTTCTNSALDTTVQEPYLRDATWNLLRKVVMKPLFNFVSDNGPFLLICGLVVSVAASLLLYTAAYLHS
jgi:hypothetical protein